MAIQVIEMFCIKHGVDIQTYIIVGLSIALRERERFEWTPCAEAFRRIIIRQPDEISDKLVFVFVRDDYSEELSIELNESIMRATCGKWVDE